MHQRALKSIILGTFSSLRFQSHELGFLELPTTTMLEIPITVWPSDLLSCFHIASNNDNAHYLGAFSTPSLSPG